MTQGTAINDWSHRVKRHAPAVVAAVLGLILSLAAFYSLRNGESRNLASRMEERVAGYTVAFQKELTGNLKTLLPIRSMYFALRGMEPYEFQKIVNAVMSQHKEIRALVWVQRPPDPR